MNYLSDFKGKDVTVMGLGLNGGGFASALFFAAQGAYVTATDLRSKEVLKPTIEKLSKYNIKYVLEKHDISDFKNADIVIKNPAVPADSPFLKVAKRIETDISVFLKLFKGRIIAVTGSKGKSTTVSAIYHIIKTVYPSAKLGGNITTSPLSFIDKLSIDDPVILELSSWQLADLTLCNKEETWSLKPEVAVITNIMPDHLNSYNGMEEYAADKKLIYKGQGKEDFTLCFNDEWGEIFAKETPATPVFFSSFSANSDKAKTASAWLDKNGAGWITTPVGNTPALIVPEKVAIIGHHNRVNLLAACAALYLFGLSPEKISEAIADFPGIPHRMEFVCTTAGISFYNDTTATIPQAVIAAAESFTAPVRLISGGTDKKLDFEILDKLKGKTEMIYLLEGSATDKMIPYLEKYNIQWKGVFSSLEEATNSAFSESSKGDVIILSPGCTSFGMFANEFHRGDVFKEIVRSLG